MAKSITTLFIRDTSINLLVMKGKQIDKWASLPLEPNMVSQGLILDEAQVADKVKQLFKQTGARADKVITAISGHDSLYRIITLPQLPDAILPEAVKREARRTIPTPLEEVYFAYQRLPSTSEGECRVFLATFPRNLVDALVRTLRQAGVRAYLMDLAPLALCRIPNEPRAIIVNARLDHLDIMVVADRCPQVVRRLSLPGESQYLEEKLPLISEEFNRTVMFYNSTHLEKPLDTTVPVFVSGELAEAQEHWPSVVGGANYAVSPLPSPVEVPEGFNPSEFMVNIGLALKELPMEKERPNSSVVNFNALPEAYIPPRFSIARVLIPVGTVIAIGLIVFGMIFVQYNRAYTEELRSELAAVKTKAFQKQGEVTTLRKQVDSLQATVGELDAMITAMERGRARFHEDLTQIEKLARNKVTLSSISHTGNAIKVTGEASDEDDIFDYARDLRALKDITNAPIFSRVWINSITSAETGLTFDLSLAK